MYELVSALPWIQWITFLRLLGLWLLVRIGQWKVLASDCKVDGREKLRFISIPHTSQLPLFLVSSFLAESVIPPSFYYQLDSPSLSDASFCLETLTVVLDPLHSLSSGLQQGFFFISSSRPRDGSHLPLLLTSGLSHQTSWLLSSSTTRPLCYFPFVWKT